MSIFDKFFGSFRNKAPEKKSNGRITIGNNSTQVGRTITISSAHRFGVGIEDYTVAVYSADSVDYAKRTMLYDIYTDIATDSHVVSTTSKRRSGVLSSPIEFRRDGVPVPEVNEQIRSPWFTRFIEDAIDARFWGFTLVQFYRNEQGWIDYTLVPRKHVNLMDRQIMARQNDQIGMPFDAFEDLLLIRDKDDLGLYLSVTPWVIWKRDSSGDWAQFSELFGMPIRKYTYDAADPEALSNAVQSATEQGGAAVFFCPTGANLDLIESGNNATSCDLYDKRIDRSNAEISKCILGNTLTTEAGENGTQALGTVHKKEEDELTKQDRIFILNLLNYDMVDIFSHLGVNTKGGEFVFVDEDNSTPQEKRQAIRTLVLDFGLPVDADVIYKTFGVEKPSNFKSEDWKFERQPAMLPALTDDEEDPEDDKPRQPRNAMRGFFVHAPKKGALEW